MFHDSHEIDGYAKELIRLRKRSHKNEAAHQKYLQYQNFCIEKFKYLVMIRACKYKKFPNYQDLEQDGFEALMNAIRTYDPKKGSFTWWADKYIATKIARSANAHSTIRIPLKKAKDMKPYKTSVIPVMLDGTISAVDKIANSEDSAQISNILKELPDARVIQHVFGFGTEEKSLSSTAKLLGVSPAKCKKILEESKQIIKNKLNQNI